MIVGRILGWLLVLAAIAVFGFELFLFVESGHYRPLAAGELWYNLHRGSLNLIQAVTQRYLHPGIWDPYAITVLTWPAWAVLAVPGLLLLLLFRRR